MVKFLKFVLIFTGVCVALILLINKLFFKPVNSSDGIDKQKYARQQAADSIDLARRDSLNKRPLSVKLSSAISSLKEEEKAIITGTSEDFFIEYSRKLSSYCSLLKASKDSTDNPTIKKLYSELRQIVTAFNKKVYKQGRQEFFSVSKRKLWEEDINVSLSGDTKIITYTGFHFAANRNIKEMYQSLYNTFERLRFKQVNFRISEYNDITYYKLSPPDDTEIPGCQLK